MSTVIGEVGASEPGVDEAGTAPGDRRFRPDVEGLRAVAVLLVVLYHANLPGLHGGYVGVDVFFVISGFVITGLLLRERSTTARTSLRSFYGRRIRRILPAATLVIVVTVVTTYAALGVVSGNPTAVAARWTAVFLANVHFSALGTDYLTASQPPSPLQNFWSLAVEEQFYLVYPATFLAVATLGAARSLRARLIAVLIPVIMASLLLSSVQTATNPTAAFFSPFTRAWELALGALVAAATPALLRLPRAVGAWLTWVGLGAVGYAALDFSSSTPYPGTAVVVPVVGTALVIAGGTAVPRRGAEVVLRGAPIQWLGRLSYSLYLWHWPILIIAAEAAGRAGLPFHRNLGWLALALVASYATYRLVEDPVRHARVLTRRRWLTIGLGVALVVTSLGVATVALRSHSAVAGTTIGAAPSGVGPRPGPPVPLSRKEVLRLVAAAPLINQLPADLTPPLAGVAIDWGGPSGECWPTSGQTTVPACEFGDPQGTRTVALYGDSHAAMWFDAINQSATAAGWKLLLLAKGNCPAIGLQFANPHGFGPAGGAFAQCDEWHRFALGRMRSVHPDLVIVTQFPDGGPGGAHPAAQWESATTALIHSLPVPAARVVVLGNIPSHGNAGPACLSLHPHDVQHCTGPPSAYLAPYLDAEHWAAVRTGARYIDTVPWFCSSVCTDVVGRYLPYWDADHVSGAYSIALAGVLADELELGTYAPLAPTQPTSTPATG